LKLRTPKSGRHRAGAASPGGGSERGSAIVELTWLGLLLLAPLVYVMVAVFTVQRSAFGASEAVRAAARAYVLAPDIETARSRALEAARLSMADQGLRLDPDDVVIRCRPTPDSCLSPGSSVEVDLALDVALPLSPSVLGRHIATVSVEASHSERYSVFRESGQ
jgi:hypothetical protein